MAERFAEEKKAALAHFEKLLDEQLARAERIKGVKEFTDYEKLDKIIIGVCGGDGIGPGRGFGGKGFNRTTAGHGRRKRRGLHIRTAASRADFA